METNKQKSQGSNTFIKVRLENKDCKKRDKEGYYIIMIKGSTQ